MDAVWKQGKPLVLAAFWGGLVGCCPYLIVSVLFGLLGAVNAALKGSAEIFLVPFLMASPLIIAFPVTLAGLLLLAVPLDAGLGRLGQRRRIVLAALCAVIGILLFEANVGKWDFDPLRAYMGASAGGLSSYLWARWRMLDQKAMG